MAEVRLIGIDQALAQVLAEGGAAFAAHYAARLGENGALVRDVVRQTLAMLAAAPREAPWGGYLAVDKDGGQVVGTCAFKTGPRDGRVEMAYFTFPPFEGQGFATAMARELLAIAAAAPDVQAVVAHTLPERNASTRVLEKLGLRCAGEVIDPEDGRVWRWLTPPQA